jgi:uncharacterized protein
MAAKTKNKKKIVDKPEKHPGVNWYQDKKIIGLIVVIVIVILYLIISQAAKKNNTDEEFVFKKQGELTFYSKDGNPVTNIDIQIAATDYDRELGLMFRKSMAENEGMLFIFPYSQIQNFWMKNTFISLDMIFADTAKQIVTIRKNTKTMSEQSYTSTEPAIYVIEVNAGFCDKHGIKVGDKINWTR